MAVHCGGSPNWDIWGVLLQLVHIRCSLNFAKRSFFGAVNGLFGKLLNLASETVILDQMQIGKWWSFPDNAHCAINVPLQRPTVAVFDTKLRLLPSVAVATFALLHCFSSWGRLFCRGRVPPAHYGGFLIEERFCYKVDDIFIKGALLYQRICRP